MKKLEKKLKNEIVNSIQDFYLPKFNEIPNVGLFLEQVTKYVTQYLTPLTKTPITPSMISNYVKKKLIPSPIKKQYYREHIIYIIFIAIAKTVLPLEHLQTFIKIQKKTYDIEVAYKYFCSELENVLFHVFGKKEKLDNVGFEDTDEKHMLRNTIIAVVHKVYLEKCFEKIEECESIRL